MSEQYKVVTVVGSEEWKTPMDLTGRLSFKKPLKFHLTRFVSMSIIINYKVSQNSHNIVHKQDASYDFL
jgi:hypothetical protein